MGNLVMVVDDSLTVRKILEVSLKRAGLEVVSFTNGIDALQALTSSSLPKLPDLIILDVMMPRLNGYSVARLLRSKSYLNHIPIIMLTSRNGMLSHLRGRIAGASIYLTKPFKTQDIIDTVMRYLGGPSQLQGSGA